MLPGDFGIGKYREEGSHFSPSGRSNPLPRNLFTHQDFRIPNNNPLNPEEIGIPFEEKISESNICLRVGVRGDSSLFDAEVVCDPLHFSSNYRGNGRIL